jgi:hypothetical protein
MAVVETVVTFEKSEVVELLTGKARECSGTKAGGSATVKLVVDNEKPDDYKFVVSMKGKRSD